MITNESVFCLRYCYVMSDYTSVIGRLTVSVMLVNKLLREADSNICEKK